MQITKEQFEAHVRAEAQREFPLVNHEGPIDFSINDRQRDHRGTYIAARMEHEWPLVEALQDINKMPEHDQDDAYRLRAKAFHALFPYTTKPTDQ